MNKIQKKFFCFVFSFPLVSEYVVDVFVSNIPYFSIAQYLEKICIKRSPLLVKQRYIHQRRTFESAILTFLQR